MWCFLFISLYLENGGNILIHIFQTGWQKQSNHHGLDQGCLWTSIFHDDKFSHEGLVGASIWYLHGTLTNKLKWMEILKQPFFQAKIWSYAIATSIFTNGNLSFQLLSQRFFDFPDLATAVREVDDQSKAAALWRSKQKELELHQH